MFSTSNTPTRGLLVSVEGISGVGKTYLTRQLQARLDKSSPDRSIVLDEFSQRPRAPHGDLGRDLLRALIDASAGDQFLRGGHPNTETLLLLAIKMYDYESVAPALDAGYLVFEGRSLHCVAVYQSLIAHADDDLALAEARTILSLASQWRPMPDLTILITDDVATAGRRAEHRDAHPYPPDHWDLLHRAAILYQRLADGDPDHIKVLDRRRVDTNGALRHMQAWIDQRRRHQYHPP